MRYAVVLERDASLLEAKDDFEYVNGSEKTLGVAATEFSLPRDICNEEQR